MNANNLRELIETWRRRDWNSDTPDDILRELAAMLPRPRSRITRKRPDERYTITREFCGHRGMRWVVRFCGAWIGSRSTFDRAARLRDHVRHERESSLKTRG